MNLILTGDVNRPGQEINILRLQRLAGPLERAFGRPARCVTGPGPLSFEAWMAGYEAGPWPVEATEQDLVIGFELPPGADLKLARTRLSLRTRTPLDRIAGCPGCGRTERRNCLDRRVR